MSKSEQMEKYKKLMSKLSDRQLQKEIKSYRKHLQRNAQYNQWTNLNPDDMNNADCLLVLREMLKERGLEEEKWTN